MTANPNDAPPPSRRRRTALVVTAVCAAALLGLAAVYGIGGLGRNKVAESSCKGAAATAQRVAPLARGEVAAVSITETPRAVPQLMFRDAEGKERTLADWRGRTVLFNLWATWCVPCRKEMPALDALQAKLGGPKFEVVAVNIDTRDPAKPKAWFVETAIKQLAYYADPSAKVFQDLKAVGRAFGMPTTLLVDPNGCEIGYLAGPAEWASPDAMALIEAAIGQ